MVHHPLAYALIILLFMCMMIHFSLADSAGGNELSDHEKRILFTKEG